MAGHNFNTSSYQQYNTGGQGQAATAPPKPKRVIAPTRDGISRCEQYYDLYGMVRRPDAHRNNRPPDAPPHRPHVSKQKRLVQEVQKKFETQQNSPKYRMSSLGNFIKMLFLIVVLPPYVLVYGLPRWILTVAIPAVWNRIAQAIMSVVHRIKRSILRCIDRVTAPFKRFWKLLKELTTKKEGSVLQASIEDEHLDFLSFVAKGIIIVYHALIRPIIKSVVWLYRITIKTAKAIHASPTHIREWHDMTIQRLRKFKAAFKAGMRKQKERFVNYVKRVIVQPIHNFVQPKVKAVNDFFSQITQSLVTFVKKYYQAIKQFVLHPIDTSRTVYRGIKSRIGAALQQVYQKMMSSIKLRVAQVKGVYSRFQAYIDRVVRQPIQQLQQKIAEKFNAIKTTLVAFYKRVRAFSFKKPSLMFKNNNKNRLIAFFISLKALAKALSKGVKLVLQKILSPISAKLNNRLESIKKVFLALAKAVVWSKNELKAIVTPYFVSAMAPFRFMKRKGNQLISQLRLGMAWMTVLLRYGMRLVSEKANRLIP